MTLFYKDTYYIIQIYLQKSKMLPLKHQIQFRNFYPHFPIAQLAGAVEYTDCTLAVG